MPLSQGYRRGNRDVINDQIVDRVESRRGFASPTRDESESQRSRGGMGGFAPHCELARVQESGREASPTNALTRAVRALARTCPAFKTGNKLALMGVAPHRMKADHNDLGGLGGFAPHRQPDH